MDRADKVNGQRRARAQDNISELGGGWALPVPFRKPCFDDFRQLDRNAGHQKRQRSAVGGVPGHASGQREPGHGGEGEDIRAGVQPWTTGCAARMSPPADGGLSEAGRAEGRASLLSEQAPHSEVAQERFAVNREENVPGRHISVRRALGVQVRQRLRNGNEDRDGLTDRQRAPARDELQQRPTRCVVQTDGGSLIGEHKVMDLQQMLVPEPLQQPQLTARVTARPERTARRAGPDGIRRPGRAC